MAAVESWDDDLDFDGDFNTSNFNSSIGTAPASSRLSIQSESAAGDDNTTEERDIFDDEQDDLGGLDIPDGPVDFDAILKKRRANDAQLSEPSEPSPQDAEHRDRGGNTHKKSKLEEEEDDGFGRDFVIPSGNLLDHSKRTVNKNIRFGNGKGAPQTPQAPQLATARRSAIPRPVSGQRPFNRLEPVLEHGPSPTVRDRRQPIPNAPALRSKRSMPALSSQPRQVPEQKPSVAQLRGAHNLQAPSNAPHRSIPMHLRRDSDSNVRRGAGARSPEPRPHSRLSNQWQPDTPSRSAGRQPRVGVAPTALAREATAKRNVTKPTRRRNYGDGSELDIFDDLQFSQEKEQTFTKEPSGRGQPRLGLKRVESKTNIRDQNKRTFSQRVTTPAPQTPRSPTKSFADQAVNNTPSYLRDTAASRIARESKLAANTATAPKTRPRSGGPLVERSTNWKQQVAARSPASSPVAAKKTRKAPHLIKPTEAKLPPNESNMVWNPDTLRWEGNENTLMHFDIPQNHPLQPAVQLSPPTTEASYRPRPLSSHMEHDQIQRNNHLRSQSAQSPPRPALIAPLAGNRTQNIQVNGGMVFDPRQMKWLKLKDHGRRDPSGPLSPSITDAEEDDPFADIEDLKDDNETGGGRMRAATGSAVGGMASPVSLGPSTTGTGEVHEEFDLGPHFIKREREEELRWRQKCLGWFPMLEDGTPAPREIARPMLPPFMTAVRQLQLTDLSMYVDEDEFDEPLAPREMARPMLHPFSMPAPQLQLADLSRYADDGELDDWDNL